MHLDVSNVKDDQDQYKWKIEKRPTNETYKIDEKRPINETDQIDL